LIEIVVSHSSVAVEFVVLRAARPPDHPLIVAHGGGSSVALCATGKSVAIFDACQREDLVEGAAVDAQALGCGRQSDHRAADGASARGVSGSAGRQPTSCPSWERVTEDPPAEGDGRDLAPPDALVGGRAGDPEQLGDLGNGVGELRRHGVLLVGADGVGGKRSGPNQRAGARARRYAPDAEPKSWRLALTLALDDRFTKPLYSVTEGAEFVGVPRSTFDTWARGYERRPKGRRPVHGEPLLTTVPGKGLTIPFIGLAEAMVLAAFRETGIPLQRIRPALDRLRQEHELHHALASEHLFSNGANVLYDYARDHDDKQLRLLTVVRSGQRVFHDVIDQYLTRITYGADGYATRLVLPVTDAKLLEVDPHRAFGQPVFIHGGARLVDVRNRIAAGEPEVNVANDYGVPLDDIRAALAEGPAVAA